MKNGAIINTAINAPEIHFPTLANKSSFFFSPIINAGSKNKSE